MAANHLSPCMTDRQARHLACWLDIEKVLVVEMWRQDTKTVCHICLPIRARVYIIYTDFVNSTNVLYL